MPSTLLAAATAVRQGRVTPLELLAGCRSTIDRVEQHVDAWVFIDTDRARAEAEELTAELRRGRWRGPLHGIPLGVKDIFDVADWPTAAGSARWAQSVARRDATVVERLRQAGAVFLGKTVTTQFASFDPPVTRNPYDPARTPGGSSSGSAAALTCSMCLGALASQTGGSITRPASYCGVVGCKPTFGRVSTDGVLPLAPSLDHVGLMARCVADIALLLRVIAGPDSRDPLCSTRSVPNYPALLGGTRSPPRLGRLRGLFEDLAEPSVQAMMDRACGAFEAVGARLSEVALPAAFDTVIACHRTVMAVESAAFHRDRLRRHLDDYKPNIRALLEEGLSCPAPEYARCKDHQRQLSQEILTCFDGVDALVTPATTGPAPAADTTGNPAFNSPWSYTGLPTVSLPAGWSAEGLPLCVQLVGPPWSEAELLATALWCEKMLQFEHRKPCIC